MKPEYKSRLLKLEQKLKPKDPAVIVISKGDPIPPEAGPKTTVIIIDDVPKPGEDPETEV